MTTDCRQTESQSSPHAIASGAPDDWRRGLIRTDVSPAVARSMIVLFLGMLFGVPLAQVAFELRGGQRPGVLDLCSSGRFPTRSDLKQYEDALQEQSRAVRFFQPRAQELLTAWGGCGTTQVVIGRDGWLFYRPGIDSVTGQGFLEPQTLRRRVRNWRDVAVTETMTPDPRPAILEFQHQVRAAGAQLILLPIPDKASLQAAQLGGRRVSAAPPQNSSFAQLVQELRSAGIKVFEPAPAVVRPSEIRYLAQDTHWTPQWMTEVACALAAEIRPHLETSARQDLHFASETVAGVGDLTEMLRLTEQQMLFAPQSVTIQRVLDAAGHPVRADAQAQVLLLGDSFTNIYSARQMGWGEGAGLAEQLAYHLGQPIDWIARNDAGAYATREMLSSQMAQGRNRLVGKRVVIWQFAARELAVGDWRSVVRQQLSLEDLP